MRPSFTSAVSIAPGGNSRRTGIASSSMLARRQDHRRFAERGLLALGVFEPDFAIDQMVAAFAVFLGHIAFAGDLRPRLVHSAVLHGQLFEPSQFAREVGHQLAEESVLECAVEDDARKVVLECEILVVVDLVEVAEAPAYFTSCCVVGSFSSGGIDEPTS